MDAAYTGHTCEDPRAVFVLVDFPSLFSLAPITVRSGKMVDFLVSSDVSEPAAVSCPCQSTYTSALRPFMLLVAFHFPLLSNHSDFLLSASVLHACSFIPFRFVPCGTYLQVTFLWTCLQPTR